MTTNETVEKLKNFVSSDDLDETLDLQTSDIKQIINNLEELLTLRKIINEQDEIIEHAVKIAKICGVEILKESLLKNDVIDKSVVRRTSEQLKGQIYD